MSPPPLPKRPLAYRIFPGKAAGGIRIVTRKYLAEVIDDAHASARDWINATPGIEVVAITPGNAAANETVGSFFVTVWFREG